MLSMCVVYLAWFSPVRMQNRFCPLWVTRKLDTAKISCREMTLMSEVYFVFRSATHAEFCTLEVTANLVCSTLVAKNVTHPFYHNLNVRSTFCIVPGWNLQNVQKTSKSSYNRRYQLSPALAEKFSFSVTHNGLYSLCVVGHVNLQNVLRTSKSS